MEEASEAAKQFAARITGREYGKEMTRADEAEAKALGLLVIFGASDDLLEFRGAFDDEVGASGGVTALIDSDGPLQSWETFISDEPDEESTRKHLARKGGAKTVTADWDNDGYSWVISSLVPHATFEIVEDEEKFCRGIVIDVQQLSPRGY
jgi:hypothetical protein